jgi:hypothetical protein
MRWGVAEVIGRNVASGMAWKERLHHDAPAVEAKLKKIPASKKNDLHIELFFNATVP